MTDDNFGCFSIYLLQMLTDKHMKETVAFNVMKLTHDK